MVACLGTLVGLASSFFFSLLDEIRFFYLFCRPPLKFLFSLTTMLLRYSKSRAVLFYILSLDFYSDNFHVCQRSGRALCLGIAPNQSRFEFVTHRLTSAAEELLQPNESTRGGHWRALEYHAFNLRKRSRPQIVWKQVVEKDMKNRNFCGTDWEKKDYQRPICDKWLTRARAPAHTHMYKPIWREYEHWQNHRDDIK